MLWFIYLFVHCYVLVLCFFDNYALKLSCWRCSLSLFSFFLISFLQALVTLKDRLDEGRGAIFSAVEKHNDRFANMTAGFKDRIALGYDKLSTDSFLSDILGKNYTSYFPKSFNCKLSALFCAIFPIFTPEFEGSAGDFLNFFACFDMLRGTLN